MTGPMARYIRPTRAPERAAAVTHRTTVAAGHRALTQSTRAVTQSVAVVAEILRSAKRPAVFVEGLMPSRLKRLWWRAGDIAWDIVGAIGILATIVVIGFVAYVVVSIAVGAVFG